MTPPLHQHRRRGNHRRHNQSPPARRGRLRRRRPGGQTAPSHVHVLVALLAATSSSSSSQHVRVLNVPGVHASAASDSRFDPYALNGGLVAAIAGPDYCILASDTRLTDGGYQIQSRSHLGGRIWAAQSELACTSSSCKCTSSDIDSTGIGINIGMGSTGTTASTTTRRSSSSSNSNSSRSGTDESDAKTAARDTCGVNTGGQRAPLRMFDLDGSLRMPWEESAVPVPIAPTSNSAKAIDQGTSTSVQVGSPTTRQLRNLFGLTLVGSVGCASDCEQLKRVVRAELAERAQSTSTAASASTVATLLLHTLYSRRPFPYYSFCVLSGLDAETGTGQVHVYDAIGSHERVAVACAGAPGREMLQPILDRMFASPRKLQSDVARGRAAGEGGGAGGNRLVRDGTALEAEGQRAGTLLLRPPVGTHVNCCAEEAVALLVKAYRAVSEREIGTGDDLVVCVLRKKTQGGDNSAECGFVEVMRFPLKKH
jgi:20S proteasome alpha/beta subunit